jgi:hypothetical protein
MSCSGGVKKVISGFSISKLVILFLLPESAGLEQGVKAAKHQAARSPHLLFAFAHFRALHS